MDEQLIQKIQLKQGEKIKVCFDIGDRASSEAQRHIACPRAWVVMTRGCGDRGCMRSVASTCVMASTVK